MTALRRRGVRFEFFHRLTNVGLSTPGPVQAGRPDRRPIARFRRAGEDPRRRRLSAPERRSTAVHAGPRSPTTPSLPTARGWRPKKDGTSRSHWDRRRADERTFFTSGATSISLLLGVGVEAVPRVCSELLARDERWQADDGGGENRRVASLPGLADGRPREPRLARPRLYHRRLREALRHLVRHGKPCGSGGGLGRSAQDPPSTFCAAPLPDPDDVPPTMLTWRLSGAAVAGGCARTRGADFLAGSDQ